MPTLCIANNSSRQHDTPYKSQWWTECTSRLPYWPNTAWCTPRTPKAVAPLSERRSLVAFRDKVVAHHCLSRWWILLARVVHQWVRLKECLFQFWPMVMYIFIYLRALSRARLSRDDHHFELKLQARPTKSDPLLNLSSPFPLAWFLSSDPQIAQEACCKTAAEHFWGDWRHRHQLHMFQKRRADGTARSQENDELTLCQQPWMKSYSDA